MRALITAATMLLVTSVASAQERTITEAALPRDVADEIVEFFNRPTTTHFRGRSRLPEPRLLVGDVAVLGGPFVLGGRIEGELVIVNGDLELEPGAEVVGDVTVVGGQVTGEDVARITGTLTIYSETLRYAYEGDRIRGLGGPGGEQGRLFEGIGLGDSRFTIRSSSSYNRVEGLPVMFGPIIETTSRNPMRVQALGIWRTESGLSFDTQQMGYSAQIEQFVGGHGAVRLGVGVHSVVDPIEQWGLSDLESSLSTFLFHKDYRDYFERRGWRGYVRLTPPQLPLDATVEYRSEQHWIRAPGGPWSFVDNDASWRPQPLIAEGRLRSVAATATLDLRSDPEDPADGWYLSATVQRGIDGSLAVPAAGVPGGPPVSGPSEFDERFVTGLVDVRRYNRVGPGSWLDVRALAGGALSDRLMPPQYQHALGGEGSLPGHPIFAGDCGARRSLVAYGPAGAQLPFYPSYGCDRFALLQVEYRGQLSIDLGFGRDEDLGGRWDSWSVDMSPSWLIFLNTGKGWVLDRPGVAGRADTPALYDVGLGLLFGRLGVYWAVPLNGEERSPNFFVRLGRSF
ncbi:MAG: hypothetical protein HY701_03935 [Gemmatimonadetes bacterium]|nr:hypothetical protein [Gemmatimonadota bacterium]